MAITVLLAGFCQVPSMTARAEGERGPTIACGDPRVSVAGRLDERWAVPVARACADLASMTDADPTARVSMRPLDDDLVLEVRLADGRSTTRRLHAIASLGPTLEALVALPVVPSAPRAVDPAEPPEVAPKIVISDVAVEFGVGLGARMGRPGPYVAGSLQGFVQVRSGPWLFGTEMRWDAVERVETAAPKDFDTETLALSLTVARRFETSFGHVDLGAAPRLVSQAQSATPPSGDESDTEVDVRPAVFTRVALGHGPLRFFLEADADASPTRLRRDLRARNDFPALPSWSAGASAGLAWGSP